MRSCLALFLALLALNSRAQEVHIPLNKGWSFCQLGKEHWYPAEVPGVVQTDLLRNGLIPDFMQGSNIDSVQWIENEDWIYRRTLRVEDTLLRHGHLDLVFKGLDTFAEVYLNDSLIGKADNMFRTWEWAVKRHLKKGENELKVIFRSPIKEGAKLREAYGIQLPHDNDPTGVSPYIRKAAYQFGWDFCPRLVTSGIWQGVELRGWSEARITGFALRELPSSASGRRIWIDAHVAHSMKNGPQVRVHLDGELLAEYYDNEDRMHHGAIVDPTKYDAWFPNGSGPPVRHELRIQVLFKGKVISELSSWIGFRDIELVQESDTSGTSFHFRVNGRPTFIRGVNLVPPRLAISSKDDHLWTELVARMRQTSMNMVRIWSGGVYPPDGFLDACDEAGILVWQDFMFGNLPAVDSAFVLNVRGEIRDQIQRKGHHPCLALWCGNNELQVAWEHWGWQERYVLHGADSVSVALDMLDFFDHELPKELGWYSNGDISYTPTSPLSNWGNAKGLTEGDLHYWGVWHGDSTFSSFANNVGRFVSEWGFQSYPDSALLAKYIHPDSLYLGSPSVARLQRSYKTDKPIWDAIERELGEEKPTTFGGFIEASQRVQAKAYGMAIVAHMAAKPHCMGTLLWQLNDCWPGPSWSIIDYEGNPKPAYEVVKRLYSTTP